MINLNPQTKKGQDMQSFLSDNPDTRFYGLGWGNKEFQYAINGDWKQMLEFAKKADWAVICYCDHEKEQMMWMNHKDEWRKRQGLKPLASKPRKMVKLFYEWTDRAPVCRILCEIFEQKESGGSDDFKQWLYETYWYCAMFKGQQTEN